MSLLKIKDKNGRWQDVPIIAGPQGPQGEKGEKGETGEAGRTPQRGTDYWTDADKQEIRAYVDEVILGGAW